jgi:hypothetical protein
MEAMLGISVQLSLSQLAKTLHLSYSLQQNWRRGQNRFFLEVRGVGGERGCGEQQGEMAQAMYAHMNK